MEFLGVTISYFEYVSVFKTRDGVKNSESMPGYSYQMSGDSSRINKFIRSSCLR